MPLNRLLRLLAGLLVLTCLVLLAQLTSAALLDLRRMSQALEGTEQLGLALKLAEMASRERGPSNGFLGEALPHSEPVLQRLAAARAGTDRAFAALLNAPTKLVDGRDRKLGEIRSELQRARKEVDHVGGLARRSTAEIDKSVRDMVAVIRRMAPMVSEIGIQAQTAYPEIGSDLQAARLLAELREYAGLLGSHLTAALAQQRALSRAELDAILHTRGRIDELRFLADLRVSGPQRPLPVRQAWERAQQRYFGSSLTLAEQVVDDSAAGRPYRYDPAGFAEAYVPDMNALFEVRDVLLEQAMTQARSAQGRAYQTLAAVLFGAVLMSGLLIALIAVVQKRILRPLSAVAGAVDELAAGGSLQPLPEPVTNDEMAAVIGAVRALQERTQQRLALEKERDSLIEQLRTRSNTDPLTGLLNRRGLVEAGGQLLEQARRHHFAVCAILLDVDHFKRLNDELGHAAGDAALIDVSEALRSTGRSSDLAGRIGGEEFVLLLSHCELEQGRQFAERVRLGLAGRSCSAGGGAPKLPLTASFGVAAFPAHGANLELLLSCADEAMYEAKAAGRNRVVTAE